MSKKTLILGLALIMALLPLTGCTPEKAEALLTAIKSFESRSLQALDAYEQLFKDYHKLTKESNDEIFQQTAAAIREHGAEVVTVDGMISTLSPREAKAGDRAVEREFYDIKTVYISLRNTYESLPQGSLLGAEYVSCGQDVVAKATNQLVNFATNIEENPLYPFSLRQQVGEYKNLVKNNKNDEARLVFNQIAEAIVRYDEQHEKALKLTLAAVEDGRRVHQLLGSYSDVSVAEILGVIQFGLDFLATLDDVDVKNISAKLASIKTEMSLTPYWQRIESIPITKFENCDVVSNL